jgi:DNA-binding GntR family transcriptional regulator
VENIAPSGCNDDRKDDPLRLLFPVHLKDNAAPYYIANILREAIYRGILAEGEALYQSQLAARLSVSPIPLREALRLLEMEGLVDFQGRRGAVVTNLCVEDIQEIYELLTSMETGLLRIAFPLITPGIVEASGRVLDEMDARPDRLFWLKQNVVFHNLLCKPAERPRTLRWIARLRRQVDRYIRVHLHSMREGANPQAEHRLILDAVRAKDLTAAVDALTVHLEIASKELQAHVKRRRTTERG